MNWLQVFPSLYKWTTFPLTCLIEEVYHQGSKLFEHKKSDHAMMVELCSTLERALNYMHTGNTAVIATTVMNPLWIGRSVVKDGMPCLNPDILQVVNGKHICIDAKDWPCHDLSKQPHSSSRRSQVLTYGESHYNVSLLIFLSKPAADPNVWTGGWFESSLSILSLPPIHNLGLAVVCLIGSTIYTADPSFPIRG